jgi:hypothetical protein
MNPLKASSPVLKQVLKEQHDAVKEELARNEVRSWIHEEIDRYLTNLSRGNSSEERRTAAAYARASKSGLEELMTVREVASLLKVCPITVRKYVRLGILQGQKILNRFVIRKASVTKLTSALPQGDGGSSK